MCRLKEYLQILLISFAIIFSASSSWALEETAEPIKQVDLTVETVGINTEIIDSTDSNVNDTNVNDTAAVDGDTIEAKMIDAEAVDTTRLSLENELQDIKKDILKINRDLFILEEDLLFPSNTQVKVFLSTDVGQYFKLDSVTIKIDDKSVANHLYTERELSALKRGAIQRLHTENLAAGKHEIIAIVVGFGPEGRDYRRAVAANFEKGTGPKYLQLMITGDRVKQQPEFTFKDWE